MKRTYIKQLLIAGAASLLIVSCKISHDYTAPAEAAGNLYRDAPADTNTIAKIPVKEFFTDQLLQALISEGISSSPDLKIALARIRQSEAYYRQSQSASFPTLNATASAAISELSDAQGGRIINNARTFQLGLASAWEADIWGKLNSAKRANLAALLRSQAYARAVQTGLIADISNYYYRLLALDQQLSITEESVSNWKSVVETMQALKEAARVTGAAVVQSEAARYAAEVTMPDLRQSIRATENALSILLGRSPGPVERGSILAQNIPALYAGVPAQLLGNRPDVQQAEYNFRYYFENVNIARSYFYPALTITASGGLSNTGLKDFFSAGSLFANLAGGLAQPIFNQRVNRTRLEVARAAQDEAMASYQGTLLNAGQEVSNALGSYQAAADKALLRRNQIAALEKSVDYSRELLKSGYANYTEVLNAQQSLLTAQLSSTNDRLQQLQATVELYRALGGGWR